MKTRHQLAAYLGLLGLTTLIAILISIRDKLLIIGPWVLDVLLSVIGLVMLYLLHKLYTKFRTNHIAMLAKQEELEGQRQTRRIESERWDVERAALLLNQHHQAARIYPDGRGFLPTLVNITEGGSKQFVNLPHPALMGRTVNASALPERAESLQDENEVPTAPAFRSMWHMLKGEKLPLCWTSDGPLFGTILDLLSMAVTGKPGRGKTTALMYYVAILLSCGAEVTIWDPHGVMGELAVLNGRVLPSMPKTARVYYYDRKEISSLLCPTWRTI